MAKKILLTTVILSVILLYCAPKPAELSLDDIHAAAITIDTYVDIGPDYATAEVDPGIDQPRLRCDLTKMEQGGSVYKGNVERHGLDHSPDRNHCPFGRQTNCRPRGSPYTGMAAGRKMPHLPQLRLEPLLRVIIRSSII